ncbi:UNVERIFIED_CONTAM: hypothetical protein Slati_0982800 [Sesamum latifolium]|uniref:Reverse transcriptase domain-containing protein n=1 Tax=Sesamum latifolium TaxID=2727402 RepID=A0AAW2XUJ5_9LAMI
MGASLNSQCYTPYVDSEAITKILVSRIKDCLDDLISPTQNAFVPGRWIGDNVMLAQELFMGYNQRHLPKRCALKVDLRKAYDTVEWDFLLEVLRLFGFPSRFLVGSRSASLHHPTRFVLMERLTGSFEGREVYARGILCPPTSLFLQWNYSEGSYNR